MKSLKINNIFLCCLFVLFSSAANSTNDNANIVTFDLNNKTTLKFLIENQIKENYDFSGMAFYLNQVQYYVVDKTGIISLNRHDDQTIELKKDQWFAIAGRFNVLLIKAQSAKINFDELAQPSIINTDGNAQSFIVIKPNLKKFAAELNQIRYHHLSAPFAAVAKASEWLLVSIQKASTLSWGLSILLFAIIIKLLLLPVSLMTTKSQQKVSAITSQLQPILADIKQNYNGEEAHNKLIQAYKDVGVSPFYTMKPMLSFLVQIPVLIAVFNALGEMPQLLGQSFLWFDDLSKPDMWLSLSFELPFMGTYINLMPIIMTVITLTSTIFHQDVHASQTQQKKQKLKLYFMAAAFLVLFYPFPAAMVMYWAMANLLQFIQTKL